MPVIYDLAVKAGANPDKVLRGVDMEGKICGRAGKKYDGTLYDETSRPFAAWPNPLEYNFKICVDSCAYTVAEDSDRMAWQYNSSLLVYYCIPSADAGAVLGVVVSANSSSFSSATTFVVNSTADVMNSWQYLGYSIGTAIVLCFAVMPLLRWCGRCLVFTCIFGVIVAGVAGGVFLYNYGIKAQADGTISSTRADACVYTAYVLWGFVAIFTLVVFFLRKRILIAIEVVKEAALAITQMPMMIVFPLFPVILGFAYIACWIYLSIYVYSVTTLSPAGKNVPESVTHYMTPPFYSRTKLVQYPAKYAAGTIANAIQQTYPVPYVFKPVSEKWQYVSWYLFFHLLWVVQFLFYFSYLAFVGATADWYFTPRQENGKKKRGKGDDALTKWPIFSSICRTFRYHLGTVAVCSFIIAVIQFIRAVVLYIEKQTSSDPPNKLQKAVFCLIKCYLRCLECCMDKINKNALIWCAIWGDNFATSACSSFMLVWANLARVAAINIVSGVLVRISKVFIMLVNAAAFAYVFSNYKPVSSKLYSSFVPTVIVLLISWFVASLFMLVFKAVIDAVFLCFLVDADVNPAGQMVASKKLQKLVGKYKGESKSQAAAMKARRKKRPGYKPEGDTSGHEDNNVYLVNRGDNLNDEEYTH